MNKILQFALRKSKIGLLLFAGLIANYSISQCTNSTAYPSAAVAAPAVTGAVTTISTCNYQTEYGTISNMLSSTVYSFANTTNGGYVTVRQGSSSGLAVAYGNSPLTFVPPADGTYYVHWTVSAACATASGVCNTTTVTNVSPATSCTNPVNAGAAMCTPAAACAGQNITLSLTGMVLGTGYTYQWQNSPDGLTYSNIVGATNSSFTTIQADTTFYQCIVTCSGGTPGTSTPVQVNMSSFLNCYCSSVPAYDTYEDIFNVSLGTLDNASNCTTTGGPGSLQGKYSDYTNTTPATPIPNVVQGFPETMEVEVGNCSSYAYNNMMKVWIDFNQNGSFLDAGEEIYVSSVPSSGAHTENISFVVPANAVQGITRMRIVVNETTVATNITPCSATNYYYGETEDYLVNVVPPLAVDAGITGFVNPVIPTCNFTDSIAVTLQNFGTDTLTSCTINWTYNNGTTNSYLWTGSLATLESEVVSIGFVAYSGGDNFSAWTSLPNFAVEDAAGAYNNQADLIGVVAGMSGNYTIGGNAPSFPDIATAISTMASTGICGPTVFDIRSGVYNEQFTLSAINGMSDINTVTFRSEVMNRDSVVYEFAGTSLTNNYVAFINGGDYYNFEHMTFMNTGATYSRAVEISGGSDNNNFTDVVFDAGTATTTSNYRAALYSGNTLDNNNTFEGCLFKGGSYGAYWYGTSTTVLESGSVFSNCDFESNYYQGLYSYYESHPVFKGNHFYGNSAYASRYAMYMSYNHNGLQVTDNVVEGNATNHFTYGIYVYYSDATPTNRGLVANNSIAVGRPGATSTLYGLYIYTSGNLDVYHNSVNAIAGAAASRAAYIYGGGGNVFQNNNFVSNGPGYAVYLYSAYAMDLSDNNNLKTTGTWVGYYNANITNLAAWQTTTGYDANSISVNPGFYGDFDLHVCSDSLNGMGAPIASIMEDMDGQPRNTSTPDIGSDEFAPISLPGGLGPDVAICVGETVTLSAGSPSDSIIWSNGDSLISTVISVPGTYNVEVHGVCGIGFDTIVVSASALNYTGFLVADTTVFCTGGSVELSSTYPADTYTWTNAVTDSIFTVTSGGTYQLNITDNCGSGMESIVITEHNAPIAAFTSTANYLTSTFVNNSTSNGTGTSYLWNFGDNTTSTDQSPTHAYANPGVYTVTLTVTNDCGTSTSTASFSTTVGLEEVDGLGSIGVYPNPSNGLFTVDFNLNNDLNAEIKVTNVLGETVYAKELGTINGISKSAVDMTNAAPGVYYVSVLSNNKMVYNNMIVKQ